MSIETLSFVMIFCEGICIVTVRKDTRTICWMGTKMIVSPGPRTPSNFPRRNTTPRSRQFNREQDVGQLGFGVAAKPPIGALGVEIVERDVCSLMRLGCRGDDAGRRALLEPLEEELAEQKRR